MVRDYCRRNDVNKLVPGKVPGSTGACRRRAASINQSDRSPGGEPRCHATEAELVARFAMCGDLRSHAVEHLAGKRLGKCSRLLFTFEIDPEETCAWNLPETEGLEFHMVKPNPHLAQLMGKVFGLDSHLDNVKHRPSSS
jgi:hypothetical protein